MVDDWWARFQQGLENGVRATAQAIVDESKPIIADEAIDRHTLLDSAEVHMVSRFHWQARWTADHAPPVNFGSGPAGAHPKARKAPPLDVILEWVKRNARLGAKVGNDGPELGPVVKPRLRRGTKKLPDSEARSLAFLIQRKIKEEGIEPVFFAERSSATIMPRFPTILNEAVEAAMRGAPAGGP